MNNVNSFELIISVVFDMSPQLGGIGPKSQYIETTGGDASFLNGKNEGHNRIINNMVRSGLLESNQHENKW